MIGLKPLENFIKLLIFSTYIKGERPISSMIIAEPEHGKTELLKSIKAERVKVVMDITAYGISNYLLPMISAKQIRTMIFPDFLRILTRGRRIVDEILTTINIIVEDGIDAVAFTKNIQWPGSEKRVFANVIIALTPSQLEARFKKLRDFGFISRILPLYYTYTNEDIERIHEKIKEGYKFPELEIKVPEKDLEVSLNKTLASLFDPYIELLKPTMGYHLGLRLRRQLQTLAKASALIKGRTEVIKEDIKEVISFTPFFFNPIKGDECKWLIMRNLPARSEELVRELSDKYSRRTVYYKLEELRDQGLIHKVGEEWRLRI